MASITSAKAAGFLALHERGAALLQPNAFDVGSARVLESLGFQAVATTSSGFAATLGRPDGSTTRDELVAHSAAMAAAVDIPVAADSESCFADDPAGVAATVELLSRTGLAGCSIEDYRRDGDEIYDFGLAVERVAAAAEAAHRGPDQLVLTARAENLLHGRDDLSDTIARLQAFQEAGADVLFAPGLRTVDAVKAVVSSVDGPVNVLVVPGLPPVAELAALGVARISVGGAFAYAAYAGLIAAAQELRDAGTYGYWTHVSEARPVVRDAFSRQ